MSSATRGSSDYSGACAFPLATQAQELTEAMAIDAGLEPQAEAVSAAASLAAAASGDGNKLGLIDLEAIAGPRYAA